MTIFPHWSEPPARIPKQPSPFWLNEHCPRRNGSGESCCSSRPVASLTSAVEPYHRNGDSRQCQCHVACNLLDHWFYESTFLNYQSCNNLLYVVKLHLAANCRRASFEQRRIASLVRRDGDDGQVGTCNVAFSHKLLALAVVEIVIRENQIIAAGRQRAPSR